MCWLYLVNFVDMWDLKACLGNFLRIKPTEIEFESNFSSISQHSRSTTYSTFLIAKNLRIIPSVIIIIVYNCKPHVNEYNTIL